MRHREVKVTQPVSSTTAIPTQICSGSAASDVLPNHKFLRDSVLYRLEYIEKGAFCFSQLLRIEYSELRQNYIKAILVTTNVARVKNIFLVRQTYVYLP